jgi:hypothetical protein
LDKIQWRSLGDKFRGERMPESMGMNSPLDPGFASQPRQHRTHVSGFHRLTLQRTEER